MSLLTPHLGFFVWTLVAFIIVLLLLRKFAWNPILKSLNQRESNIADSIATAEKVRAEMAQLKSENEALKNSQVEINKVVAALEQQNQILKASRHDPD